jgi:hypothetical protein
MNAGATSAMTECCDTAVDDPSLRSSPEAVVSPFVQPDRRNQMLDIDGRLELDDADLNCVAGGMQWENGRRSENVIDCRNLTAAQCQAVEDKVNAKQAADAAKKAGK